MVLALALIAATHTPGTGKVAFVAGATVYVASGRTSGLFAGDTVTVTRDGRWIATLRATTVTTVSAACDTLRTAGLPEPGDAVAFVPHADSLVPAAAEPAADIVRASPPAPRRARRPWRGSMGAQWLSLRDPLTSLNQPGMDLRVEGSALVGQRVDVSLDWRATRSVRQRDTTRAVDPRARLWRASVAMHDPEETRRIVVGRQMSSSVATVSLFDGALIEFGSPQLRFGGFAGTQPEPVHMHYSLQISEVGGYVEWRQPPRAVNRWSVTVGGVSSRDGRELNREFAYLQASYLTRRVTGWLSQELDVHRGWRRELEGGAVSLTSTFASTRVDLGRNVEASLGYDSRRNVRLWRDHLTPETAFDDGTREGAWLGSRWTPVRWVSMSGEMRTRHGDSGRGNGWNAGAELRRLTRAAVTARGRLSGFRDERVDSRLSSLGVGADPPGPFHLEVSGGARETRDLVFGSEDRETWLELSGDVMLPKRFWLSASVDRTRGDIGTTTLQWWGLRWRF